MIFVPIIINVLKWTVKLASVQNFYFVSQPILPCEKNCPDFFIGPESDHWLCLSVTHSLTDSLTHSVTFSNLIDATLACEDAYSKLVKVVTVADVSDEDRVGNSLLQIWKPRFGHNPQLLFRL